MSTTVTSTETQPTAKGPFDLYLKAGLVVSFRAQDDEVVPAKITRISQNRLTVILSQPTGTSPFRKGERIRIKYWDEGATVYGWWATVSELRTFDDHEFEVNFSDIELHIERRKVRRLRLNIPFSFTIVESRQDDLTGHQLVDCTTQDISIGGLRFETDLSLKVGDKLDLRLHLTPDISVAASGWVVRSQALSKKRYVGTMISKHSNSVAVQFLQARPEDQRELLRFLAQSQSVQ